MNNTSVLLLVMDGWGLNKDYQGNAITRANTPTFDHLWEKYPRATLEASGLSVGLPEGQMGTSEVNHLTIGAGRVIHQNLVRVNQAIETGEFFENEVLVEAFEHVKENGGAVHLMGLVSPGGVHSHQKHLFALLQMAKRLDFKNVLIHMFTDGRDTSMHGAEKYVKELDQQIKDIGVGKIVSVVGRYYAMDRDHNWERTDKAYELITQAKGKHFESAEEAIQASYDQKVTDEFIEPVWLGADDEVLKENDSLIFFNYRNDRPRQITERILAKGPKDVRFVTMTQYEPSYGLEVAYAPMSVDLPLGEVLSKAGIKQLRITETEKFAHMTYFINCKYENAYEGEDRIMLDTYSDIKTHDERPEMRAADIAREIIQDMKSGGHQVILTNICNPDMVGHTGNLPAVIKACEETDRVLGEIIQTAKDYNYEVIVTADHGNADEMIDEKSGEVITSHSTNPVPLILVSDKWTELKKDKSTLIDIAPTILTMLDIEIPEQMQGESLV